MKPVFLFEFCDQDWIPSGARECLYEIMDACNSGARSFNGHAAETALELARQNGLSRIVELGAGRAPVTAHLAKLNPGSGLQLVPCDITPNVSVFRELSQRYPDCVFPEFESVDITQPNPKLFHDSVLVMATMMHHVPFEIRPTILRTLSHSRSHIAMFEPLRRTVKSILLVTLSFFPAILLPLLLVKRPGTCRRVLWCWLIPIVPYMFIWDGIISCLRQWNEKEWLAEFEQIDGAADRVKFQTGFHSQQFVWSTYDHKNEKSG